MSLSGAIDRAVKAYIDHTNVVLAGDSSLNISYLTQPFDQIASSAQLAQQALNGAAQLQLTNGAGEEEGKGKRKRRAYKARDPNAPKRPLTAYFRYLQENRSKIGVEMQEKAGGVTQRPGDLSKEATERWNSLSKAAQQPYRDAYQHALKEYEREVARHKAEGGELSTAEESALKRAAKNAEAEVEAAAERDREDVDAEAADVEDDDDDDDDDSSSSSEDEEEEKPLPPPPPPKAPSPETSKKTPKSALKKSKQGVTPTPQFSSINPEKAQFSSIKPENTTSAPNLSSSPERKRKTPATPTAPETEQGKKKRGRKTNAEKAAAEADAAPTPAPVAASSETEQPKKRKRKVKASADA